MPRPVEICIIARHAESAYNVAGLVNGDPAVPVALSPHGVEQACSLAGQLAGAGVGACVHTRFGRTLETARLALEGCAPPPAFVCEPLLDDIGCGAMEGRPVADEHAWRGAHARDCRPPGGESIRDAALRIARGLGAVASRPEPVVAIVSHDLVVRYAVNAARGSADIAAPWREAPHATAFRIEQRALIEAADRIGALAASPWGRAIPGPEANGG